MFDQKKNKVIENGLPTLCNTEFTPFVLVLKMFYSTSTNNSVSKK